MHTGILASFVAFATAIVVAVGVSSATSFLEAEGIAAGAQTVMTTDWGRLTHDSELEIYDVEIDAWPRDGRIVLPTPFPNLSRAYCTDDPERGQLMLEFSADATSISLHRPESPAGGNDRRLRFETVEKTRQFGDGRIVLSALDARVEGTRAKLETHPGNHRIGFWTNSADTVHWTYMASRPGMYRVELTYSAAGEDGTQFDLEFGERTLHGELPATGSWYKYTTIDLGRLYLDKPRGEYDVAVRCTKKVGVAVMNLKAITLRPTSEGRAVTQAEDDSITCHARDATVHGTKLQYEPKRHKDTLGYWVNPTDWASWDFRVHQPRTFGVEILQGCGARAGGSEVTLTIGEQSLRFVVEETGHFQNFVPRIIGSIEITRAGDYRLSVRPIRKAKGAVMDLRRVRLVPYLTTR